MALVEIHCEACFNCFANRISEYDRHAEWSDSCGIVHLDRVQITRLGDVSGSYCALARANDGLTPPNEKFWSTEWIIWHNFAKCKAFLHKCIWDLLELSESVGIRKRNIFWNAIETFFERLHGWYIQNCADFGSIVSQKIDLLPFHCFLFKIFNRLEPSALSALSSPKLGQFLIINSITSLLWEWGSAFLFLLGDKRNSRWTVSSRRYQHFRLNFLLAKWKSRPASLRVPILRYLFFSPFPIIVSERVVSFTPVLSFHPKKTGAAIRFQDCSHTLTGSFFCAFWNVRNERQFAQLRNRHMNWSQVEHLWRSWNNFCLLGLLNQNAQNSTPTYLWSDGTSVSKYAGFWDLDQPNTNKGSCVTVSILKCYLVS